MNIRPIFNSYSFQSFNENFSSAIIPLNKKIIAIAVIAFALLAACIFAYCHCLSPQNLDAHKPQNPPDDKPESVSEDENLQNKAIDDAILEEPEDNLKIGGTSNCVEDTQEIEKPPQTEIADTINDAYSIDRLKSGIGNPLILQHIIAHLPSKTELGRLAKTSNEWNTHVKNGKVFWINHHPDISLFELGMRDFKSIFAFVQSYGQQLECLNLNIDLTDDQLKEIILLCPKVKKLFLTSTTLTDEGIAHLKSLAALQNLNLSLCKNITDEAFVHLEHLTALESLHIYASPLIKGSGLLNLKQLPKLRSLHLIECLGMTEANLSHLGELKSLQLLNLSKCAATNTQVIESLLKITGLKNLILFSCNGVIDHHLPILASLPSLKYLNLKNCGNITEDGIDASSLRDDREILSNAKTKAVIAEENQLRLQERENLRLREEKRARLREQEKKMEKEIVLFIMRQCNSRPYGLIELSNRLRAEFPFLKEQNNHYIRLHYLAPLVHSLKLKYGSPQFYPDDPRQTYQNPSFIVNSHIQGNLIQGNLIQGNLI